MPQQVDILSPLAEARNAYSYSADGVKLRVVKKYNSNFNTSPIIGSAVNVSLMDVTKTTDYVAGKIFENNVLDRIFVDGGYIKGGVYYFYETDHLGDNRAVINQSGTVVERNDYYPYGMQMAHNQPTNSASGSDNKRKFSGKELDVMGGLNTYDFEARPYDLNYINFWTPDSKTEKKPWISPYVYCSGNPVNRMDPDGQQDFAIPGVGIPGVPYWPADPKTGQAMVDLVKKVGNFIKTAVVIGVVQQVVNIEKTINGENGQGASQTNGENKTQDTKEIKEGKYGDVANPKNVGSGKSTTPSQRKRILEENKRQNGGQLTSDGDGRPLNQPKKNIKGQKADLDQAEVDHIEPKSKGGSNDNSNLRVISKEENLKKGNKTN